MVIWSIYLIRDKSDTLYTGISTDVSRRFQEHCSKTNKASKYTRARKGLKLVYSREIGNRSLASKAEYRMKRLAKKEKELVVYQNCSANELLTKLGLC